jgi:quercetin dioxygenase-like cupin family protein
VRKLRRGRRSGLTATCFSARAASTELVYVVSGTLELRVGDRVLTAGPGETITYSPRDAHTWRNPSESEEAVVLWFAVPNPFLPAKPPRG